MARPRQFDEAALLDAAVELFWSQGYAETSIEDVVRATGIGNGSIYAAYLSKDGLYIAALTHYCGRLTQTVREAMSGRSGDPAASMRTYLDLIIGDCVAQPERRGCLMLNSVTLIGRIPQLRPIIDATTRELQDILQQRILRDLEDTALATEVDVQSLSAHYVTLSQGLIQRSRLGRDPGELHEIADAAVRHTSLALSATGT